MLTQHSNNGDSHAAKVAAITMHKAKLSISVIIATELQPGFTPCPSDADCEEIVLKLKVPQQLACACMLELSDISSSTVLPVALDTLNFFKVWAASNRLLPQDASKPLAGLPKADDARAALANTVNQQLQAGLPQHLIGLMSALAQQLAAAKAAPAAYSSPTGMKTPALLKLATQLLSSLWLIPGACDSQDTSSRDVSMAAGSVAAAGAAASMGLVVAVLDFTDWLADVSTQQQVPQECWHNVLNALASLFMLFRLIDGLRGGDKLHALPSATRTCGLLAVLCQFIDCLKGRSMPAAGVVGTASSGGISGSGRTGSSNAGLGSANAVRSGGTSGRHSSSHTSSTGGSSSGLSVRQAAIATAESFPGFSKPNASTAIAEWLWEVASTNLQSLPDVAPALVKCMGLSKLQLACIAACLVYGSSSPGSPAPGFSVSDVIGIWDSVLHGAALDCQDQQQQAQQQHEGRQQGQQSFNLVQGLAQLELSAMLLDWVATCHSSSQQFAGCCVRAVRAMHAALHIFTDRHRHQQQQQQQIPAASAQATQSAAAARLQLVRLLSKWADRTVPMLLSIMTRALHRAQEEASGAVPVAAAAAETPQAAASSNAASSSSSASSGGSGSVASVLVLLLEALHHSTQLLAALWEATVAEAESAAGGEGLVGLTAVWDTHAVEAVSVLEGVVRLLLCLGNTEHAPVACRPSHVVLTAVGSLCLRKRGVEGSPGALVLLAQRAMAGTGGPAGGGQQEAYLRGFASLLVSGLKLSGSSNVQGQGKGLDFCCAAAFASAGMLEHCAARCGVAGSSSSSSSSSSSTATTTTSSSTSSSGSVSGLQQPDAARYVAFLPWLVLLGRCCLNASSCLPAAWSGLGVGSLEQQLDTAFGRDTLAVASALKWFIRLSNSLAVLLGAQQLVTAGYPLQNVHEQFCVLYGQLFTGSAASDSSDPAAAAATMCDTFAGFVLSLRTFGVAASSIPVPDFCNNPGCGTATGQPEAELVSGRSCVCGGCCVARFCGCECQQQHWGLHKPVCRALAAAGGTR